MNEDINNETKDRVERLIGLEMDDRLDEAGRRELDELLRDDEGLRVRDEMLAVRAVLSADAAAPMPVPPLLRDKIVARVATARANAVKNSQPNAQEAPGGTSGEVLSIGSPVLRMVRSIAAAAAVVLGATGWFASGGFGGMVRADDVHHVRTIEDEIRDRTDEDGSIREFLAWKFLGADRKAGDAK